jgi:hypothetical protein
MPDTTPAQTCVTIIRPARGPWQADSAFLRPPTGPSPDRPLPGVNNTAGGTCSWERGERRSPAQKRSALSSGEEAAKRAGVPAAWSRKKLLLVSVLCFEYRLGPGVRMLGDPDSGGPRFPGTQIPRAPDSQGCNPWAFISGALRTKPSIQWVLTQSNCVPKPRGCVPGNPRHGNHRHGNLCHDSITTTRC